MNSIKPTEVASSPFHPLRPFATFAPLWKTLPTDDPLVAEYALSGIGKPIGIAKHQLVRALPKPLDTCLPGIEQIEAELGRIGEEES